MIELEAAGESHWIRSAAVRGRSSVPRAMRHGWERSPPPRAFGHRCGRGRPHSDSSILSRFPSPVTVE